MAAKVTPRKKDGTMQTRKASLLSIGAAVVSASVARATSALGIDGAFRPFSLVRFRGEWAGRLAVLGAGMLVAGVGALLLAPASVARPRSRIAKGSGRVHQNDGSAPSF
jgi:hypothetical protein